MKATKILHKHGSEFAKRGGDDFPLKGYQCISESPAEGADWVDQTDGLLSGMKIGNKIYVREELLANSSVQVLKAGKVPVLTMGDLVELESPVPPRAAAWAVLRFADTVFLFISVHLSGGRFDDEIVKKLLEEEGLGDMSKEDLERVLAVKSLQLDDVMRKVHAMAITSQICEDKPPPCHPARLKSAGSVVDSVAEQVHNGLRADHEALPPVDYVVLGGDCNSYSHEVTRLRSAANPQFSYACSALFGPYEENKHKVDGFLRYQTVPDSISSGMGSLKRVIPKNGAERLGAVPSARSTIYGGVVDHFFVLSNSHRMAACKVASVVAERGLAMTEAGDFVREASDHNPISLELEWSTEDVANCSGERLEKNGPVEAERVARPSFTSSKSSKDSASDHLETCATSCACAIM